MDTTNKTMPSVELRWGKYGGFEGPWTPGKARYVLPPNPTAKQKMLAVITTTEGGCYDAVNMYDACKMSLGLLQWCDAFYIATNLLGAVVSKLTSNAAWPVVSWAKSLGYSFHPVPGGKDWRFAKGGNAVNTPEEQREMYFGSASGKIGSWTSPEDVERANTWAEVLAGIWNDPRTRAVQDEYSLARIEGFALADVRKDILQLQEPRIAAMSGGEQFALQAAYLSFAANNQTKAREQYVAWKAALGDKAKLDQGDLHDLLRRLTFGPQIAIYPTRYNKIRPLLEKFSGLDLPDFADDLKGHWTASAGNLTDTLELQKALISLGYDLGPRGADGIAGNKTTEAIRAFQADKGLSPDGIVGPKTIAKLTEVLAAASASST